MNETFIDFTKNKKNKHLNVVEVVSKDKKDIQKGYSRKTYWCIYMTATIQIELYI